MTTPILQTKLHIPDPPRDYVSRPRLLERLNVGVQTGHLLILVSAPAGFGKTTLLSEWISQSELQTAWISLDEGENDSIRFLTYFISALQRIDPTLGEDILSVLTSPQPPSLEITLTALLNQLDGLPGESVLVLDDYHLIENRDIHRAITFFIENLSPNTHLVILSRADPPMPLARLRARGQMTELRAHDLRFMTDEIIPFMNLGMHLDLSIDQIQSLESRTEGWIAGLQMAALSIRGKSDVDEFLSAFSGSHRFILDYLTEEVLGSQPETLQEFILQTAILDRLCGSLCEAVTGQIRAQETLEKLEELNLFLIPLDDERIWYRYHHLFKDVMTNRLQRVYPDQIHDLQLRAAKWYENKGFISEALEHALAADKRTYAAELIEGQAMTLLRAGSIATLNSLYDKLPNDLILKRPMLSMFYAWVMLLIGKQAEIEYYLDSAEKNLHMVINKEILIGNISAIRAYASSRIRDFDTAIKEANKALTLLPEDDHSIRAVVVFVLGWIYYSQGDFQSAIETMHQAGRLGEMSRNIHVAIQAWSAYAYFLKRQGNYKESERVYKNALQIGIGQGGKPLPFTAIIYSGLADLYLLKKDVSRARQFAEIGLDLAKRWLNVDSQVGCYLTLAQVEAIEGNLNTARTDLEEIKQLATTHQLTQGNQDAISIVEAKIFGSSSNVNQASLPEPLTERELEVLQLLSAGKSNRDISEELVIALGTTKTHISRIMGKLNAENRTQAVILARELGLIS